MVLVGGGSLAWIAYGALLWWFQEAMIFPAPGGPDRDTLDQAARELGAEPLALRAADGTALYGWYKAAGGPDGGRRAVLYFHGNAETVAGSGPLMRLANQRGWDFGVVAYRGYPGSEGAPSEAGIALDARALWDEATVTRGLPADRIVLHGRSLGGAVAASLAEQVDAGGLVLESTFRSVVELAGEEAPLYPIDLLLRHRFDTWSRAPSLALPALVLVGSDDRVVTPDHGKALAERLPEAQVVEVQGGEHHDLLVLRDPAAKRAWLDLLERVDRAPREETP